MQTSLPIRAQTDTKLADIVFVPDVRLGDENREILTLNGKVVFLQMVGVTQYELSWLWQDSKKLATQRSLLVK
ncbi:MULTISPECIES: suppressor of fused domain protein [unclassified Campylobacter]|uniref:suppressor of fused domain protein n=1 Tax=unclassified Campylobacter TaxID=2593542 RepID=UPI003D35664E